MRTLRKRTSWLILICLLVLLVAAVWGGGGWAWNRLLALHGIRAHATAPAHRP